MFRHKIAAKLLLFHLVGLAILSMLVGIAYFNLSGSLKSTSLLTEEMEELHLVVHLRLAIIETAMPPNDYLILGADPKEETNFFLLAQKADELFHKLGTLEFDREEERIHFKLAKDKYINAKEIAEKIFALENPYGNPTGGN